MLWDRTWPFSIPPDQLSAHDLAYIEERMLALTPAPPADDLGDD